jgi:hypothetical protein
MLDRKSLLGLAPPAWGTGFLLIYPMALVWPAGWARHHGAHYEAHYFMMIVGVYATLGVFLLLAYGIHDLI